MSEITHLLVVLGLLMVSAWAIATFLTSSRATQREIGRRANLVAVKPLSEIAAKSYARVTSAREIINQRVRDFFSFGIPRRWGMRSGAITLIVIGIVSAAAAWLLINTALHFSPWFAVPAAFGAFMLAPRQILKRQQDRVELQFMDLFPASLDMIVRMLRAGLTITGAIRAVGNEAPPPVDKVFTALSDQVEIGILFNDALVLTGERIGMPDFRFFAVAVSLQHATGGNIAATLEVLSDIIRKRRLARLKAKSTTAEVRVSAFVLGSLPFIVLAGLLIMSPGYLAPLINDPRGNAIVGTAIVFLLMGFGTMRQMMRSATRF